MIEIELEIEEIYGTIRLPFKQKTYCPDNIKITITSQESPPSSVSA